MSPFNGDEDKIKEDPKTLRKMRIDYLYKLNVKGIKKPNERLLNLYSITFNNETGKSTCQHACHNAVGKWLYQVDL